MVNPIISLFPSSVIEKCSRRTGKPILRICQICKKPYKRKNNAFACSQACCLQVRFWSFVVKTDTCWEWIGQVSNYGYGQFTDNYSQKKWMAHRFAYTMLVGPIPDGLVIDHLCRQRACVNPAHLEPVTHRVNAIRGNGCSGLNYRKTHCKHGHLFDAQNTHITTDGFRRCRTCIRRWAENARLRKRLTRIQADGNHASTINQTRTDDAESGDGP